MPVLSRMLLLLMATGALCFADVWITATNPNFPNASSNGTPAKGDPLKYGIQDVTLSGPSNGIGLWTLTIDTNYGTNINGISGAMPGFCDLTGASFPTCPGSIPLFLSDVIIQQGGNTYGIVLSSHSTYESSYSDGYVAGNLYQAPGVLDALHFGNGPVILAPGVPTDDKLNTGQGSESAAYDTNPGCPTPGTPNAGKTCAEYTVTDTFSVTSSFLNPNQAFTIIASAADCDNEFLMATTPEPGFTWLVPPMLLGGYFWRRWRTRVS